MIQSCMLGVGFLTKNNCFLFVPTASAERELHVRSLLSNTISLRNARPRVCPLPFGVVQRGSAWRLIRCYALVLGPYVHTLTRREVYSHC